MTHLETLTPAESTERDRLEAVIDTGSQNFFEVLHALATIRNKRLYRDKHSKFEDYLKERHKALTTGALTRKITSRQRVDQLLDHVTVIDNLVSTNVAVLPENESQTRPLSNLSVEEQKVAWLGAKAAAGKEQPAAVWVQGSVNAVKQVVATGGFVDLGNARSTPLTAAITKEADELIKRQRQHINDSIERKTGQSQDAKHQGAFTVIATDEATGHITLLAPTLAAKLGAGEQGNYILWVKQPESEKDE